MSEIMKEGDATSPAKADIGGTSSSGVAKRFARARSKPIGGLPSSLRPPVERSLRRLRWALRIAKQHRP